jgi:hypothetical protein
MTISGIAGSLVPHALQPAKFLQVKIFKTDNLGLELLGERDIVQAVQDGPEGAISA